MSFRVNSWCCCGGSLKNGTRTIGILTLISVILSVAGVYHGEIGCFINQASISNGEVLIDPFCNYTDVTGSSDTKDDVLQSLNITFVVFAITSLISSIMILMAVSYDKPYLLIPWLLADALEMLVGLGWLVYLDFLVAKSNGDKSGFGTLILVIAIGMNIFVLPIIGVSVYFWMVVYSYYHELKSKCEIMQKRSRCESRGQACSPNPLI